MPRSPLARAAVFALALSFPPAFAAPPAAPEFAEASDFFGHFNSPAPSLPVAFNYDGHPAAELMAKWPMLHAQRFLSEQREEHTVTYTDPATGLAVRCVAVVYRDFPTVEWTVYFKNTGTADTPILANIQALDTQWTSTGGKGFILHHQFGTFSPLGPNDFIPQVSPLEPGKALRFVPAIGRPTGGVMPYFNLERGDNSGVIVVVGWPGAWAADFVRDAKSGIRVTAGQELTHLRLHPGEEIRTPLMVLQFWRGDWIDAQNTWRRWMFAHNLPRPGGEPPKPMFAPSSSAQFGEMINADEASQLLFIDRYREERFPLDIWWMDAGWYEHNGRWQEPLAFRVDRKRFPHGLRPITDSAHARGLKSVVWFEPERVMPSNELFQTHPDWLLPNLVSQRLSRLLYLGNPAAREWLTDTVSRLITSEGIDVYRQDFCILEPAEIWRSHDEADRQGITENHHLTGYLTFWDELLRRHPDLIIDSCAGGGSRNDLETMRRALPFFRSDYIFDVVANQSMTYGLSLWLPYFGGLTGPTQFSTYELRSNLACPMFLPSWDLRDRSLPYGDLRREVYAWRDYAQNYRGDFYPLTPPGISPDSWIGWQFNRPETGRGVVQAFRRDQSVYETARLKLRGLEPGARYRFTDLDQPAATHEYSGADLMQAGLAVTISTQPGAVVINYEKLTPASH